MDPLLRVCLLLRMLLKTNNLRSTQQICHTWSISIGASIGASASTTNAGTSGCASTTSSTSTNTNTRTNTSTNTSTNSDTHTSTSTSTNTTVDGRNLAPPYLRHMSKARGEWYGSEMCARWEWDENVMRMWWEWEADATEMRITWERGWDASEIEMRLTCEWDANDLSLQFLSIFLEHPNAFKEWTPTQVCRDLNWFETGQIASDFDKNWSRLRFLLFEEILNMAPLRNLRNVAW
jgi:hypothetical protein